MAKYTTKNKTFAITKYEILFHPALSADSKTVLTYVSYFEKKPGHIFFVNDIRTDLRIGPTKWRRISKELRSAGYLKSKKVEGNKERLDFTKVKPKKSKSQVSKRTLEPGIETDAPNIIISRAPKGPQDIISINNKNNVIEVSVCCTDLLCSCATKTSPQSPFGAQGEGKNQSILGKGVGWLGEEQSSCIHNVYLGERTI